MITFGRSLTLRVSAWEGALRSRFARLTQRERFLVLTLAGIALAALVWLPFSQAAEQRDRLVIAEAARDEAQASARRLTALSRAESRSTRLEDLHAISLQAESVSIARILIEQRLTALAVAADVDITSVTVGAEAEDGATPLLKAEFVAPYVAESFWRMMERLSASEEAIFIDTIDISANANASMGLALPGRARPTGQARVVLLVPVVLGALEQGAEA